MSKVEIKSFDVFHIKGAVFKLGRELQRHDTLIIIIITLLRALLINYRVITLETDSSLSQLNSACHHIVFINK